MTSGECFGNKWFYMKYIVKYLSVGNTFDPWMYVTLSLSKHYKCTYKMHYYSW